jgi:hypothetical protein
LGVEKPAPGFSWLMEGKKRNQLQSAYRILVSGSRENLKKISGIYGIQEKLILTSQC